MSKIGEHPPYLDCNNFVTEYYGTSNHKKLNEYPKLIKGKKQNS